MGIASQGSGIRDQGSGIREQGTGNRERGNRGRGLDAGIRLVGGGWFRVLILAAGGQSVGSHVAPGGDHVAPRSAEYARVQNRLARGWNTWDVHSVATRVLLPEGLAIHVGMKHNSSLNGDAFLGDALNKP